MCTANVCPTKRGDIVDLRDQVLITFFFFVLLIALIFFASLESMKGPFFNDLGKVYFLLLIIYLLETLFFLRVLYPFAGTPQGDTG